MVLLPPPSRYPLRARAEADAAERRGAGTLWATGPVEWEGVSVGTVSQPEVGPVVEDAGGAAPRARPRVAALPRRDVPSGTQKCPRRCSPCRLSRFAVPAMPFWTDLLRGRIQPTAPQSGGETRAQGAVDHVWVRIVVVPADGGQPTCTATADVSPPPAASPSNAGIDPSMWEHNKNRMLLGQLACGQPVCGLSKGLWVTRLRVVQRPAGRLWATQRSACCPRPVRRARQARQASWPSCRAVPPSVECRSAGALAVGRREQIREPDLGEGWEATRRYPGALGDGPGGDQRSSRVADRGRREPTDLRRGGDRSRAEVHHPASVRREAPSEARAG
jgi:hypothetical protein